MTDTELRAAPLKEELMTSVAHDMQTPLAVLSGMMQSLARDERVAVEHRDILEAMNRQTIRLRHLVGQFLDYARIEAGQALSISPAPTTLAGPVEAIARTFAHDNPIEVEVPEDLPPALVDADRLMQVVANLISNAVKFSPPGSAILISALDSGDDIELTVTDHGCGMTESELSRAFDKFYRGSAASGTTGSGLGLYISREIVESQGGRITATGRPGEGCRLVVHLPKASEPEGKDEREDERPDRR